MAANAGKPYLQALMPLGGVVDLPRHMNESFGKSYWVITGWDADRDLVWVAADQIVVPIKSSDINCSWS
jgi:hypothetical protein